MGLRMEGSGPACQVAVVRLHMMVALAFFVGFALVIAWSGPTSNAILRAAPLVALGAFPICIVGMSRALLSGMAGRDLAAPSLWSLSPIGAAAGALLVILGRDPRVPATVFGSLLWAGSVLLYSALVVATIRRPRRADRPRPEGAPPASAAAAVVKAGGTAYAVASAVALPLASTGVLGGPSALHLVLAGFVTLTLAGVAANVLPRFTGAPFPERPLRWAALPLVVGPGLVAWGLTGEPWPLRTGAVLEAFGLSIFALGVLRTLMRSPRRRRTFLAYAGSSAFLLLGVGVGVAMAIRGDTTLMPVHATANLLGFVGLFVIGFSTDFFAPALAPSVRAWRVQSRSTILLALTGTAVVVASAVAAPDVARLAAGACTAAFVLQLGGAVATHRRAHRQRGRIVRDRFLSAHTSDAEAQT